MNYELPGNDETLNKYLAALTELDRDLLDLLDNVASENKLTENEALALAIIGLWSRAKDVDEGRVYISIPAAGLRVYDEPQTLLLGEAHGTYAEVLARLRGEAT